MEEMLDRIACLSESELRVVMDAIQKRYTLAYPDWEVIYIAIHKDPKLRTQEIANILNLLNYQAPSE